MGLPVGKCKGLTRELSTWLYVKRCRGLKLFSRVRINYENFGVQRRKRPALFDN